MLGVHKVPHVLALSAFTLADLWADVVAAISREEKNIAT